MNVVRAHVAVVAPAANPVDAPPTIEAENVGFLRAARPPLSKLSIIVPCFNEAANLEVLLPRLQRVLGQVVADWEVILVDDGSRDATDEVLTKWCAEPGFRGIQLSRNFGKEIALTAGIDAATGDAAVLMDADLQHPPELIAQMVDQWRQGFDVVYAVRSHRADEAALKRVGARWFYRLMNVGGRFEIPPDAGDFRLLGRPALDALRSLPERNRFMKGLYAWVGLPSTAIEYQPTARNAGRAKFTPLRLLTLSIDGLTSFTTWPLRTVSAVGLALAVLALLYGAFLVVDFLRHGHPIPGYTTIVVGLALLSGIQLVALGVLGEYVSRIFEEVKGRPLYVVRHQAGRSLHAADE